MKRNLQARGLRLDQIDAYDFVFHGPVFDEVDDLAAHKPLRDIVAALEKALAGALVQAGYTVLNAVNCRRPLDLDHWAAVKASFAVEFPGLDQIR